MPLRGGERNSLPCPPRNSLSRGAPEYGNGASAEGRLQWLDIASEGDPRKRRAGCFSLNMFRSVSFDGGLASNSAMTDHGSSFCSSIQLAAVSCILMIAFLANVPVTIIIMCLVRKFASQETRYPISESVDFLKCFCTFASCFYGCFRLQRSR